MKKLLFVVIIWLTFIKSVIADPVELGLKGGFNFSNLGGDVFSVFNYGSKVGFAGGVLLNFRMSESFFLQPEAYYTMKGQTSNYSPSSGITSFTLSFNYIEIPILLKREFSLGAENSMSIYAGPYTAFLLNATISYTGMSAPPGADASRSTSNPDFGLSLGAELELKKYLIDVRYDHGIIPISNFPGGFSIGNNVFSVSVGYLIL